MVSWDCCTPSPPHSFRSIGQVVEAFPFQAWCLFQVLLLQPAASTSLLGKTLLKFVSKTQLLSSIVFLYCTKPEGITKHYIVQLLIHGSEFRCDFSLVCSVWEAVILCRILVPEYGFMQLQLIPMLVGFFTYKIATFIQAIEEALPVVGEKTQEY